VASEKVSHSGGAKSGGGGAKGGGGGAKGGGGGGCGVIVAVKSVEGQGTNMQHNP
jgi:hypothetical protein